MAPSIDGQVHTFEEHGLYDGLFLMRDDESLTYWDHMTGEAVYGPLTGEQLEVRNLYQTTVEQVLDVAPDAQVAVSERELWAEERLGLGGLLQSMNRNLNPMFQSTVKEEDDRRPTMDLGIGIWEGHVSRYYPHETVAASDNAVFDTFNGRRVLVLLDPTAYALAAYYTDAESFRWDGKVLRLSDGSYLEGGVMYDGAGDKADLERPLQVFTRWYGFSLTFPETEIYGES
jgi:hypothetical protein